MIRIINVLQILLFVVILFSIPFTYFIFISEPIGVPMGGYDQAYLVHRAKLETYGKIIIFFEFLSLFIIFYKLRKQDQGK